MPSPIRFRVIMSAKVAGELQAIFTYIATDSRDNAAKTVERLLRTIETLEFFPPF